jgi:dolichol-phosphate mannosyltransferase
MNVLVVLPTYDEAETIEDVLRRTREALPDAGILVVDDGSPDGTADLAEKIGEEIGGLEVMRRDRRRGLGDAYRAGFAWGLGKGAGVLVEMDSDLSHDPGALPGLVAGCSEAGLVIGSRYVAGGSIPRWAWHRRLLSKGGNVYSSLMLGVPVKDMTSGFRAYRSDLLEQMDLQSVRAEGYGFQIEMTYRAAQANAQIVEVPIDFVDRTLGQSKMSAQIVAEAFSLVTIWGAKRLLHLARTATQRSPREAVSRSGRIG